MPRLLLHRILVVALAFSAGSALRAEDHCANRDFRGIYGVSASGDIVLIPPPFTALVGPFVRVGRLESDGQGNVSVQTNASYNGFILTEPFGGTYTVNPDCSIVFHLLVPLPILASIGPPPGGLVTLVTLPFTFVGALADDGRDVLNLLVNPPGAAIRVHLSREDHDQDSCTTKEVSGGYQLGMSGRIVAQPPNLPGSFARVGNVTFDGSGGFSGNTTASYGGFITPEALAGSYSVDALCNITMKYSLGGASYTWQGTLTNKSRGADLILSDPPGAVVSGTLKKQ